MKINASGSEKQISDKQKVDDDEVNVYLFEVWFTYIVLYCIILGGGGGLGRPDGKYLQILDLQRLASL